MDSPGGILYLAILILLLLSAFFSASETALTTVNKLRMRKKAEEGDNDAKAALALIDDYDKSLFSILIGNNLVNIATSSIATVIATAIWGNSGAAIATGVATLLVLTFGEILPKTYAKDNSERIALWAAHPLRVIIVVLTPLAVLFSGLKTLLFKLAPSPAKGPSVTEEELIYMIGSIEEEGVLEEQERELVQSALEFDEISIHEILTPRVNIFALDVDTPVEEIRDAIMTEGYSRIPVYEENIDNIIGVLYIRDFYNAYITGGEIDLRAMVGEPLFVHKRMKLSRLLTELKAHKVNIAVVTDDYGGTLGIVTMEDVLEELVGDIYDEDDDIPDELTQVDDHTVEVAGDYNLETMLEVLGMEEGESGDYLTVNGWASHQFEHIPQVEETFDGEGFVLTVLEMDGHRIKRLRVSTPPPPPELPEE